MTLHAENTKIVERFDVQSKKWLNQWKIPGAAIAIVSKDEVIYIENFGVRSLKTKKPVDENTVFPIASLSKSFTAELTLLIAERELLKLDDKVIQYFPDFKLHDAKNTNNLTINDLLGQKTGLPNHASDNLIDAGQSLDQAISALKNVPLICDVGTCYSYQNVAFSITGNIVEKVTQKNYEQLLKENIFEPLNMKNASASRAGLVSGDNYSECHKLNSDGVFVSCPISKFGYALPPAGGVNASLNDLIIWLRAQMGYYPEIISTTLLNAVQTPQVTIPKKELDKPYAPWQKDRLLSASYGRGWRIDNYAGTTSIFHSGSLNGTSAAIGFLPEHEIGIVVLINTNDFPATLLMAQFFDLYLNLPPKDWSTPLLEAQMRELQNKKIKS